MLAKPKARVQTLARVEREVIREALSAWIDGYLSALATVGGGVTATGAELRRG